jgi:hypothetical protein
VLQRTTLQVSGLCLWADDYVLVARFAFFQEAIDYCLEGSSRGVDMKLISRLVPGKPFISDYPKKEAA